LSGLHFGAGDAWLFVSPEVGSQLPKRRSVNENADQLVTIVAVNSLNFNSRQAQYRRQIYPVTENHCNTTWNHNTTTDSWPSFLSPPIRAVCDSCNSFDGDFPVGDLNLDCVTDLLDVLFGLEYIAAASRSLYRTSNPGSSLLLKAVSNADVDMDSQLTWFDLRRMLLSYLTGAFVESRFRMARASPSSNCGLVLTVESSSIFQTRNFRQILTEIYFVVEVDRIEAGPFNASNTVFQTGSQQKIYPAKGVIEGSLSTASIMLWKASAVRALRGLVYTVSINTEVINTKLGISVMRIDRALDGSVLDISLFLGATTDSATYNADVVFGNSWAMSLSNTGYERFGVSVNHSWMGQSYRPLLSYLSTEGSSMCQAKRVVCASTEYLAIPATLLSTGLCKMIRSCTLGVEFEFTAPTNTSDRECQRVSSPCLAELQYLLSAATLSSDRVCRNVSDPCDGILTYQSESPSRTSDRVCKQVQRCSLEEFQKDAATPLSDVVCQRLRVCASGLEYEVEAPTMTSDRKCAVARQCDTSKEFESVPNTNQTDRECLSHSFCVLGVSFESQKPTPSSDRICSLVKEPCAISREFELALPTLTSDRVCQHYSQCDAGLTYENVKPTTTSDRVCHEFTRCGDAEYETLPPTITSDRACQGVWVQRMPPTLT
jgi:hypothetical protein